MIVVFKRKWRSHIRLLSTHWTTDSDWPFQLWITGIHISCYNADGSDLTRWWWIDSHTRFLGLKALLYRRLGSTLRDNYKQIFKKSDIVQNKYSITCISNVVIMYMFKLGRLTAACLGPYHALGLGLRWATMWFQILATMLNTTNASTRRGLSYFLLLVVCNKQRRSVPANADLAIQR